MYEIDDVKGHDYLRPKNPSARDNNHAVCKNDLKSLK